MSREKKKDIKNKPQKNIYRYNTYIAWGIAIFSFFLYANTIGNDYNLDDELVTRGHPLTSKGIAGLIDIFTKPYFTDASGNVYEYRPMVLASFALEHQFFGESPMVSHFFNALLYGLLIFLLFKLLRTLFSNYNLLLPFGATLLFAVHPIHTEVVASIKNRDEILAFIFGISAFLMAIKYIRSDKYSFLLLSTFLFLLGILSKKSVMPFALIIPMALILFNQPRLSQLLYIVVPLSVISSVTSYFFEINTRFIFFIIIISVTLFFYILNKAQSYSQFKQNIKDFFSEIFYNPIKGERTPESPPNQVNTNNFFISVLIVSLVFCAIGIINNSKHILSVILIFNIFVYFFSFSKLKEIILIIITFSAAALLTQNAYMSGIFLVVAYLFKIFDYKNRIHQLCLVIILISLLLNTEKVFVLLSCFFLIGLIVLHFRIKKTYLISKFFSFLFVLIFIVVSILSKKFKTEILFISVTFLIIGISFFLNSLKIKKFTTVLLILIIPLTLLGEMFSIKGYSSLIADVPTKALSIATDIMPASGRSLEFAEMPITQSSPLVIRAGTAFLSMAFYLKLLILPHPLGFYYGYDTVPIVSIVNLWALVSLLVYLSLFLMALFWFKKNKIISFAILYYLICISIFSNIVAPVAGLIAERLAFIASLGFCIAIAYLLLKLSRLKSDANTNKIFYNQKFLWGIIIIVSLYSFKTFSRNAQWKNHLSLFENDMVYLKRSAQAHNLYANALMTYIQNEKNATKRDKMFDTAIEHFNDALNIYPDFYNASYSLGKAYFLAERLDEALITFEKTLTIDSTEYMVYMYLGIINDEKNNYEKSVGYYQKTIEKAPEFTDAYTNLSALYIKQNETQKAIETNLSLLKIKPDAYDPNLNIGKIYFSSDNLPSALEYFEKAFAIDKSDKNLVNAMYEINKSLGNTEKADFYLNLLRKPG